jgi:hypothetical protein
MGSNVLLCMPHRTECILSVSAPHLELPAKLGLPSGSGSEYFEASTTSSRLPRFCIHSPSHSSACPSWYLLAVSMKLPGQGGGTLRWHARRAGSADSAPQMEHAQRLLHACSERTRAVCHVVCAVAASVLWQATCRAAAAGIAQQQERDC